MSDSKDTRIEAAYEVLIGEWEQANRIVEGRVLTDFERNGIRGLAERLVDAMDRALINATDEQIIDLCFERGITPYDLVP